MDAGTWARLADLGDRLSRADPTEGARLLAEVRRDPMLEPYLDRFVAALSGADAFADALSGQLAAVLSEGGIGPGDLLGSWRVDRVIGQGGMGVVYLAHRADEQFEKIVALKVMASALADDADRARFLAERRTLARLEHPGIARLIDAGIAPRGNPYYVLEHVEGVSADAFADGAPLDAVLDVFLQVCAAVSHAHANLVVHCDLKPSNVLVTPDGRAKLLDFGIARGVRDPGDADAASLSAPMTRSYAAPELLRGDAVDTRADVYSLGVLLYRLLVGAAPYVVRPGTRDELYDQVAAHVLPEVPASGRLARSSRLARRELSSILARAMSPAREGRLPSVQHLSDEISAWRSGAPLAHPPAGVPAYRFRKGVRRNPLAAALGAASGFSAVAAIGVLAWALVVTRAEERRARQERAVADEIVTFVEGVFEEADPERQVAERGQATARELIERAADRLGRDAGENPNRIRLQVTIGRLARLVGATDRAEALLRPVSADPRDPSSARAARIELAELAGDFGDSEAAQEELAGVVEACDAARDRDCALEALRVAARNAVTMGDPANAASIADEGLARLGPGQSWYRAEFALTRAFAAHGQQQWDEALTGFEDALRWYEEAGEGRALAVAEASTLVAEVYFARGEFERALPAVERARSIYLELLDPQHLYVGYVDRVLSNVLLKLGRVEDAIQYARESVAIRRARLGSAHPDTAESLTALARAELGADHLTEALAALVEARDTSRGSPPRYHNAGRTLAMVYASMGDRERALAVHTEALSWYEEAFGPQSGATERVRLEREEVEARLRSAAADRGAAR